MNKLAFCVELNRCVSITEARLEYLSLPEGAPRFRFLCPKEPCWDGPTGPGVPLFGANYTFHAEDSDKFVAPYFRLGSKVVHRPNCSWDKLKSDTLGVDSSDEDRATRRARRKLTDLVTVFDPRASGGTTGRKDFSGLDESDLPRGLAVHTPAVRGAPRSERAGEIQTSDFHSLIDSYLEAKVRLSTEEFNALALRIVGSGTVPYRQYFQHINYSRGDGVTYAGAWLVQSYGQGFKLRFIDKREGCAIFLYISPQRMAAYRYSGYLSSAIEKLDKREYRHVTVYALGTLVYSAERQSFNLEVHDLRHLYLLLKNPVAQDLSSGSTRGNA